MKLTAARPPQLLRGVITRAAEHGLVVKLEDDTRQTFPVPPGRYRVTDVDGCEFEIEEFPPRHRGTFKDWLDGQPKEV